MLLDWQAAVLLRVWRLWIGLVIVATCDACVSIRFSEGAPLPREQIAKIRASETTKAEILAWFGAPQGFSDASALEQMLQKLDVLPEDVFRESPFEMPFSDALVFRYSKGTLEGAFFGVYTYADLKVNEDTLVVFFDQQDRVLYYGFKGGTDALEERPTDD